MFEEYIPILEKLKGTSVLSLLHSRENKNNPLLLIDW